MATWTDYFIAAMMLVAYLMVLIAIGTWALVGVPPLRGTLSLLVFIIVAGWIWVVGTQLRG